MLNIREGSIVIIGTWWQPSTSPKLCLSFGRTHHLGTSWILRKKRWKQTHLWWHWTFFQVMKNSWSFVSPKIGGHLANPLILHGNCCPRGLSRRYRSRRLLPLSQRHRSSSAAANELGRAINWQRLSTVDNQIFVYLGLPPQQQSAHEVFLFLDSLLKTSKNAIILVVTVRWGGGRSKIC